jgi:hypothetical protein
MSNTKKNFTKNKNNIKKLSLTDTIVVDYKRWIAVDICEFFDKKKEQIPMSCLLNPSNNKMCCLGFAAQQSGVPVRHLRNVAMPDVLMSEERFAETRGYDDHTKYFISSLVVGKSIRNTQLAKEAARVNDNTCVTIQYKMTQLYDLFKKHKKTILFKNVPKNVKTKVNSEVLYETHFPDKNTKVSKPTKSTKTLKNA